MKDFHYSSQFQKQYKRLPQAVKKKLNRQLKLLLTDYRHGSLASKKMTNQKNIWEARIDKHHRFTFTLAGEQIILRAVGTHEIYRNP